MKKNKRSSREIIIKDTLLKNKNVSVKIGTIENRESPETVYIYTSFWVKPKDSTKQEDFKKILEERLNNIYNKNLKLFLSKHELFPQEKNNIFLVNIPENINYNGKRNFISIELYLHTKNINSEKKYPLNDKKNTQLFDECLLIANKILSSDVLLNKMEFIINKKSKS